MGMFTRPCGPWRCGWNTARVAGLPVPQEAGAGNGPWPADPLGAVGLGPFPVAADGAV